MAQLIKPQQLKVVTKEIRTKEGECEVSIVLELNINLNLEGVAGVSACASEAPVKQAVQAPEMEWAIPDFDGGTKIKFGKTEE